MLAMHPNHQEKIRNEIDDFYQTGNDISLSLGDLVRFPHLDMCLKEVLRLFPSGAIVMREISEDLLLESSKHLHNQ
jgi:cytochrome P450